MSSSTGAGTGDGSIGVRIDETTKRKVQMRVGQLGYGSMSDYVRALIEDDLDGAELPPLDDQRSG